MALVCSAGWCEATIQLSVKDIFTSGSSSLWIPAMLHAVERAGRERADKGARQLLLSLWLVCHRSSRYIEHTCTSQSIVCEWHQFQGLNVMIYRPAPGPWAKLSSHTLNLLLTRLGSRKILFARRHGIRDPEFAVRRRCGGWTLVHTRLLYLHVSFSWKHSLHHTCKPLTLKSSLSTVVRLPIPPIVNPI